MDPLLLAFRLVLSATFALAALAKLTDRSAFADSARDFGVPEQVAPAVAVLVPLVELAAALALLTGPAAWGGALLAFALLIAFTTLMVLHLLAGRAPACHCFGVATTRPVGLGTVLRNLVLTGMACVLLLAPGA